MTEIELARADAATAAEAVKLGAGAISPMLSAEGLAAWRAEVKRLCAAAGVRVRTGFGQAKAVVWATQPGVRLAICEQVGLTTASFFATYGNHGDATRGRLYEAESPEARVRLAQMVAKKHESRMRQPLK